MSRDTLKLKPQENHPAPENFPDGKFSEVKPKENHPAPENFLTENSPR